MRLGQAEILPSDWEISGGGIPEPTTGGISESWKIGLDLFGKALDMYKDVEIAKATGNWKKAEQLNTQASAYARASREVQKTSPITKGEMITGIPNTILLMMVAGIILFAFYGGRGN